MSGYKSGDGKKAAEELAAEFLKSFQPVADRFAKLVNDVAKFIEDRKS